MINDKSNENVKRKNVGLFVEETENAISLDICKGAMRAAEEENVNLFIFPASVVFDSESATDFNESGYRAQLQYNALYRMYKGFGLDGIVLAYNNICVGPDEESRDYLFNNFKDIPVVAIGEGSGFSNVQFDNYTGIQNTVKYLVEQKQCERIAFLAGAKANVDSNHRLMAFKEAMSEHGLSVPDDYIAYGDFAKESYDAVASLFNSAYDMQAIVCANDHLALQSYLEASNRGFKIGTDLLIVGYDDIKECMSANPPLATVRADHEQMGYEALHCCLNEDFTSNKGTFVVQTEFIPRESVGTKANGLSDIITSISMLNQNMIDKTKLCDQICEYVISSPKRDYQCICQKTVLNGFYDRLISHFFLDTIKRNSEEEIYNYFDNMIERNLLIYADPRRMTDVFDVIYQAFCGKSRVLHTRMVLHTLISRMEHKVMEWVAENANRQENKYENIVHLTNDITRDVLNFDDEAEKNYSSALEKIDRLSIYRSILCIYDNPVECLEPRQFQTPYSILVKAYQDKKGVHRINRTAQRIIFSELYTHPSIDDGDRHTYIVLDLFSQNYQLGLFLYEVNVDNIIFREFLTCQISTAVKVTKLFARQRESLNAYISMVERIKLENEELLEASTVDALTNILNRRGFYEEAEDLILHKRAQEGYFLVAYADLDYLKNINDAYGHDDGDYAIRKAANILSDTFGEFALVGRIGGDEFAIIAYQKRSVQAKIFKDRLTKLLDRENERNDKPYDLSISLGIMEFPTSLGADLDAMIGEADDILYEEKRIRHNQD